MPLLRMLPWALWAALLLFSVATYEDLPAAIPRHLNASGAVTATTTKSLLSWLMVPGIGLLMLAFISGLAALLPKKPQLFNFPEKERFLTIPEAYRGPVIARMRETLDVTNVFMVLVFGIVQIMMWRVSRGDSAQGYSLGLIIGTILFTPGIFLLTARVNRAVDEAEQRWKASGRKA
jgi:uncharacterized membrane protein